MKIARSHSLWFGFSLFLALGGEVSACPNCKEALANQGGPEAQRLADGYSYSIMAMIAMPFTLLGTGALLIARAARRGTFPEL
ncbi:hypothetical protein P12x_004350 [Tundrisphaera lichenicola]|uniref:hypothetical protein n=1 Tax=Tundrisphaera lichenicola TaxID=2029860 RepID=UPI003EBD41B9